MKAKRKQAFTLVEIMIVIAIIAILAAVAIPAFLQYRERAVASVCASNIEGIQLAKLSWSTRQGGDLNPATEPGEAQMAEVEVFIDGGTFPQCGGQAYTVGVLNDMPVCTNPNCPNFVDPDP